MINKTAKIAFYYLAILLLLLLGEKYINGIVEVFFNKLNYSGVITKTIFLLIVSCLCVLCWQKVKINNLKLQIGALSILGVYLLYRFNIIAHPEWFYAELFYYYYYVDALFILPIITFFPYLKKCYHMARKRHVPTPQVDNQILQDVPITKKEDDKFGYSEDAKQLAQRILDNRTIDKGALTIGLQGDWGKGKTSYLNLLKSELGRKEVIVVEFNPWRNYDYNRLANNFLGTIAKEIDDISIQHTINDYAKAIADADINLISKTIGLISNKRSKYADELFEQVSRLVGQLDRCLVIIIDDLDRLTGDEIFNTIRLLRNITNFNNTVFIVAYDRTHIVSNLKAINIEERYLEKIFNVTYLLPQIPINALKKVIGDRMKKMLLSNPEEAKSIDSFIDIADNEISLRNGIRLASSIALNKSNLLDADKHFVVDLLDYLLLHYLESKSKKAFDYLSKFSIENNSLYSKEPLRVDGGIISINKRKASLTLNETLSDEEFLNERLIHIIGDEHVSIVYKILTELFSTRRGICRITYANSYSAYFNRKLEKELITRSEFDIAFDSGSENFQNKLKEWVEDKDTYILDRLIASMQLTTKNEWIRAFEDTLSVAPLTYGEWINIRRGRGGDKKYILPEVGIDLLLSHNSDYEQKKIYAESLIEFLFDEKKLANNTIETISKKFMLFQYFNPSPLNSAFIIVRGDGLSTKKFFELYWNKYIELGIDYSSFNEDFWFVLHSIYMNEKLELREILKKHIEENILDFIKVYTPNKLINSSILYVFSQYAVNEAGNGASGSDTWKPDYIAFIESIQAKNPSKELSVYIADCKENLK